MSEVVYDVNGEAIQNVHPRGTCGAQTCAIHQPSDHPLAASPFLFSWATGKLILYRVCSHGENHLDLDDWMYRMQNGAATVQEMSDHTAYCDGCCLESEEPND